MREALREAGAAAPAQVRGIAVDTTGSTPVLADRAGKPLALGAPFAENPNAMFVLWKDHTAVAEAERLNHLARTWGGVDYTKYVGGIYSSEWFWAKAIHVLETDAAVAEAAVTIVEHCDWIPAVLTGTTDLARLKRSRCAAGHKALWHAEFGGYPSDAFLAKLQPAASGAQEVVRHARRSRPTRRSARSRPSGRRSSGLPRETVVAVGAFDAHMGAVGGGIGRNRLLKVMGTSTCDIVVAPPANEPEKLVSGICGQVDGSVIRGMIGYEAGQSAFGDVYAWFKSLLSWPLETILPTLPGLSDEVKRQVADGIAEKMIPALEQGAAALEPRGDRPRSRSTG